LEGQRNHKMARFDENNFKFNVELNIAAQQQLQFLKSVNFYSALNDENSVIIRRAIYRYERFWLPLLAKNTTRNLAPPLDVEWIWHCHLLSPHAYREDCMNLFGKVLDHRTMTPQNRDSLQKVTMEVWDALYPDEPFQVDFNATEVLKGLNDYKSGLTYDLVGAVSRQKAFYYQVSLPHYKDEKFLQEAVKRYKMFLYLKQQHPKVFLVPFYDIDLIWHSHQLHPSQYHDDTSELLGGRMLNHDDTTNDRSPGSTLFNADLETRDLWKKEFGKEIAIYGTMYRGEAPENKLYFLTKNEMFKFCDTETTVQLDTVTLAFEQPESCPRGGKFKVRASMEPKGKRT